MLESLRRSIPFEEFDYQTLLDSLRGYAHPRKKITTLLRKGEIIRVKKGLYLFGERHRRSPYCRELLANLIHGPSCISLEYALHYHGLTPERVETVTSVACSRSRSFDTPVGAFSYDPKRKKHFITVEDDRLFDLKTTQWQEIQDLVLRTVETSDRIEGELLECDQDSLFMSTIEEGLAR